MKTSLEESFDSIPKWLRSLRSRVDVLSGKTFFSGESRVVLFGRLFFFFFLCLFRIFKTVILFAFRCCTDHKHKKTVVPLLHTGPRAPRVRKFVRNVNKKIVFSFGTNSISLDISAQIDTIFDCL